MTDPDAIRAAIAKALDPLVDETKLSDQRTKEFIVAVVGDFAVTVIETIAGNQGPTPRGLVPGAPTVRRSASGDPPRPYRGPYRRRS